MLGILEQDEIENLLKSEIIGRIGCCHDGIPYIVPINYAYDGKAIIAHSVEGKKIDIMRKNPVVCFQVDLTKSTFNWRSVIAWGNFEEIFSLEEKADAMDALSNHIMPFSQKATQQTSHGLTDNEENIGTSNKLIFFKIILVAKTGRFERS